VHTSATVKTLTVRPSMDLGRLAGEHLDAPWVVLRRARERAGLTQEKAARQLQQLTRDHTFAEEAADLGRPEAARDASERYRGARLAGTLEWADAAAVVNASERAFLDESRRASPVRTGG
jgi:hypothetical protein